MGRNSSAAVMVLRNLPQHPRANMLRRHAAVHLLCTLASNAPTKAPTKPSTKAPAALNAPIDVARLLADTRLAVDESSTRSLIAACRDTPERFGFLDLLAACDVLALLCSMQRCDDPEAGRRSTAQVAAVIVRLRERMTALRQRKAGSEGLPDEVLAIVNGLNATEQVLAVSAGTRVPN